MALLALLFLIPVPVYAGLASQSLCPAGLVEKPNAGFSSDDVGCSLCYPAEGCAQACVGVPTGACPESPPEVNEACCTAAPCNVNCPEPPPLLCSFQRCTCDPGGCCSVVCPTVAPAPAASSYGLITLVLALAAIGTLYVRRRLRAG